MAIFCSRPPAPAASDHTPAPTARTATERRIVLVACGIWCIGLLRYHYSPRTVASLDRGYDRFVLRIDDRNVVRKAVGRIELAAVARERDAPRTLADRNLRTHAAGIEIDDRNAVAASGGYIKTLPVGRARDAFRSHQNALRL